ncbi:MAG TPA: hypothetical protein VIX87_10540 [Steroidobacteraceae bacterium]
MTLGSSTLQAQDHPDDQHDQRDQHDQQTPGHHDENNAPRSDQARPEARHPEERQPQEHHGEPARTDPVVQYRHDHPGAAARCHDGFFTKTTDRNRACTKHGGIDVWLVL